MIKKKIPIIHLIVLVLTDSEHVQTEHKCELSRILLLIMGTLFTVLEKFLYLFLYCILFGLIVFVFFHKTVLFLNMELNFKYIDDQIYKLFMTC